MDFAPYQSSPPETSRALSPPRRSATTSPVKHNRRAAPRVPSPSRFARPDHAGEYQDLESNPFPDEDSAVDGRDAGLLGHRPLTGCSTDVYQTSLPFRMEVEAALAYIVIPPAGGIILLIFEHTSDYVRFHAWQSALLFTASFVLHLLLSWSSFLSWSLFLVDLGLICFLAWHAYTDAETLDRLEIPFVGPLASSFVDRE